ncbi:MAG: hypothetical protein JO007_20220 [Alphaproteobacteria bacterium]|nr:hypothetical protein [Alphaproteobacteria bacterium]
MSRSPSRVANLSGCVRGTERPDLLLELSGYSVFFLIVAFLKSPTIFIDPRFWAEEGVTFYARFLHLPFTSSIAFIKSGSILVLTNAIVYIATKVPTALAPAVTTYAALLLHLVVVCQIVLFVRAHSLAKMVGLLLVAAWALLPQTFEVWLNATNIQWITGVSMLVFLAMPAGWIEQHWKGGAAWCLVCGLSGVPATVLAPFFFLRAFMERSFTILILAIVLSVTVVAQLAILTDVGEPRPYLLDPWFLVMPLFLQSVLSPVLSAEVVDKIAPSIVDRNSQHVIMTTISVLIAGIGIMGFATAAAYSGCRKPYVWLVLMAWLVVTIIQNFGSIDPRAELSGWAGGRYFLFGSMCLCLLLAWGTEARQTVPRVVSMGLLIAVMVSGIYTVAFSPWCRLELHGPSWRKQVKSCAVGHTCKIIVWPGGSWILEIEK